MFYRNHIAIIIITTSPKNSTFSAFVPLSVKNRYTSLKWRPPILYRSVTVEVSLSSTFSLFFSQITLIMPSIASRARSSLKNPMESEIS